MMFMFAPRNLENLFLAKTTVIIRYIHLRTIMEEVLHVLAVKGFLRGPGSSCSCE